MVKRDFKIIYFLLFSIFLLCPDVYAAEFNMNSYTSATNGGTKNRYRATEIYNTGMSATFTFGTRYTGRISDIETYFDYPFVENTTYRLTYNMATEDFRNNFEGAYWWDCDDTSQVNPYRSSVSYISYKKIQVTFTPLENTTCIRMWVKSTSLSNTPITGISNWSLTNITIYDPDWQSGSGSGSGSGQGTSTPPPTSSTDNTQDIINNQNNNTQDIIENNNQNTQEIVNSNKSCQFIDKNKVATDGYLNGSSVLQDGGGQWGVTDYINIYNGSIKVTEPMYSGAYTCFYDSNKTMISCFSQANFVLNQYLNIPQNSYYARFSIYKTSNIPTFEICLNGSQAISDAITDSDVDSGIGSGFFNDFSTSDNGGISAIVTKPLVIVNQLLENNGQCTNLQLPNILGVEGAYFPSGCILWNNATPVMVSLWNAFVCGLASYYILKDLFVIVENLKDPENDKVEVIDL